MTAALVDSHYHLDYLARDGDLADFAGVLAIAEANDDVICSVGIHPQEAAGETADAAKLIELAAHPKVVAIGETGLDYYYDKSPREAALSIRIPSGNSMGSRLTGRSPTRRAARMPSALNWWPPLESNRGHVKYAHSIEREF